MPSLPGGYPTMSINTDRGEERSTSTARPHSGKKSRRSTATKGKKGKKSSCADGKKGHWRICKEGGVSSTLEYSRRGGRRSIINSSLKWFERRWLFAQEEKGVGYEDWPLHLRLRKDFETRKRNSFLPVGEWGRETSDSRSY